MSAVPMAEFIVIYAIIWHIMISQKHYHLFPVLGNKRKNVIEVFNGFNNTYTFKIIWVKIIAKKYNLVILFYVFAWFAPKLSAMYVG